MPHLKPSACDTEAKANIAQSPMVSKITSFAQQSDYKSRGGPPPNFATFGLKAPVSTKGK